MSHKQVVYYVDSEGKSPVLSEIEMLVRKEKAKILGYVSLLEEKGEELRRPIADYLGGDLYELRPKRHRVLYFFLLRNYAIVVHLFRKKSDRIPDAEKRIAYSRMQDFKDRYEKGLIRLEGETAWKLFVP